MKSRWLRSSLVVALVAFAGASTGFAEDVPAPPDLEMGRADILGERDAPRLLYVVPSGRSGRLRAPRKRDYTAEILEPLVRDRVENDEALLLGGTIAAARPEPIESPTDPLDLSRESDDRDESPASGEFLSGGTRDGVPILIPK